MDDYSSDSEFEVVVDDEPEPASDGSSWAYNESMDSGHVFGSTTAEQEGRDENMNLGGGGLVMPVR